MTGTAPSLPDFEAISALMERVRAAATDAPALAKLELSEVLRFIEGKRAIFSGQFGEEDAIIRFYFDEPRAYARRDWEELTRTWPYMSDGPYRVNKPLFHYPDLGLLIVRREAGQPLLERLWQSEKSDRAAYIPGAVQWLRHYTRPTERPSAMRAASWLSKAEKRLNKQASARLRPMLKNVRAELHRILPSMQGKQWRVATSHGDFHPNNLLVGDGVLTGIDTGGSARLPLLKDMARFMTHMRRRGLLPSDATVFGVDKGSFDHFSACFDLTDEEREVWLPFMIGIEALLRVETTGLSRSRIRRAQAFYETMLDDLRVIDV
jgi:hypothetical protein